MSIDRPGFVLLVANDFPPISGAGVQRAFYFARYLPELGWRPTVLTVREVAFPSRDPGLLGQLPPEVRVERTESFELRRLLHLGRRLLARREPPRPAEGNASVQRDLVPPGVRELARRLRAWLFVPDDRILWLPFAVPRALRLLRAQPRAVVLATVPCYSSGVLGALVSRLSGRPLVLDLRDPWTRDPYVESPSPLHRWLDRKLESWAVNRASRVIVISSAMRDHFAKAYPRLAAEGRLTVLTNGFDRSDLDAAILPPRSDRPVLLYAGSLYAHHRPALRAFCSAWSRVTADVAPADAPLLRIVGRTDAEAREELESWAIDVECTGFLSHRESLGHLERASSLLLLIKDLDPARHVITIPGKLFEYLASGHPILMIGPEGDAADMVRDAGGAVHREDDAEGIAASLRRHLEHPVRRSEGGELARYERRHLTARLADLLEQVADS